MRFGLVTVTILLAVAGRSYGRPRDPDPLDNSQEVATPMLGGDSQSWSPDSRERPRELKDIQSMDQSLRTVATQLLNSTKHEDLIRIPEEKIVSIETPMQVVHISTRVENAVGDVNNNNENDSTKLKFGIPVNSKFGHFEITNPGHAMAMTDEEIEKEMATAYVNPTQKLSPTTPSLLSTWIQLYPISSTTEGNNVSDVKVDVPSNQILSSTGTKLPSSTIKQTTANTKPIRKTEAKPTTVTTERTIESSTKAIKNASSSTTPNYVKITTTTTTTSIENDIEETDTTDKKTQQSTTLAPSTTKSPSKKSQNKNNTTPKSKLSTPKNSTSKSPKPNNASNRVKPLSTRRPNPNKNDTLPGTSKVEKVTLKPHSTLSYNRSENTDRPIFITKIQASLLTDNQKTSTAAPTTTKSVNSILSKSNFTHMDTFNAKIPSPTRVNNVLKVHLKKPTDDTTKIEIQPIRVNPPVLTIEKIGDVSSDQKADADDQDILKNSKIDVKFDFNSDVSKVEVQTQAPDDTISSSTVTSTTKRSRTSSKRKKNKNRRRKTSTTSTTLATTNLSSDEDSTSNESINIDDLQVTGIQESKIEPESKAPPSKKKKPNQQTQIQKPISTQIYNFISREVMPSVGVMSLVGLGLGLASYFLYPFGGVIARRNYDVEPNYKYNIDEYGGNYGLSEEEVLSKVYSGMTKGQHHETKYHTVEKNPNYYKYTNLEQTQPQPTTRYTSHPMKNHGNRVIYRPVETTAYETSYRNSEFKYPDVPTTPNYYERQRQQQQTDFVPSANKPGVVVGNNRQFVVGSVPKEYSSEEADKMPDIVTIQDRADHKLQFSEDDGYNTDNVQAPAAPMEIIGSPEALVSKNDEEQSDRIFDDMKITSNSAVVEHGPRSLKFDENIETVLPALNLSRRKRSILPDLAGSFLPMIKKLQTPRIERSSVIQVIPSKSEIEKEKKEEEEEEDLSNEILDIIDEAVPLKGAHKKKHHGNKDHVVAAASKQHPKSSAQHLTKSTTSSSTSGSSTSGETKQAWTSTSTTIPTTSADSQTEPDFVDQGETTLDWREYVSTTTKPEPAAAGGVDVLGIAKRIFEVKLRLGLTILKHASEGLARYLGHVQKRFNGEE